MKALLKMVGLVLGIIGVILLAFSEISKMENNGLLILSGGLIIGGLVVYIVLNNLVE